MSAVRYDLIGAGYAHTRREDPDLLRLIHDALGDARTVVNVGAGAGAYEPRDRHVTAIEPSDVMAAQRPPESAPAIRATAGRLPLRDDAVDAAMAMLTVHHWDHEQRDGICELRRVARDQVVILTFDPKISSQMWLLADYLPEIAALDRKIFPRIDQITDWLGGQATVQTVPITRNTPDWTLGSFWAHPDRVLDPKARNATSGFARMSAEVVQRAVREVDRDLRNGAWDRRYGHLRQLDTYDAGLRLITTT